MKAETKESAIKSMLRHPNTIQGGGNFSTINWHYGFIGTAIPAAGERAWSTLRWEIHFKISCLLRSASTRSMKPSNNLASRMLASHYIIINRHSVSANLIKASLPLKGDRATSNVLSQIRCLNLPAWDQTLGCSEFIKVDITLWEPSEQPARIFKTLKNLSV